MPEDNNLSTTSTPLASTLLSRSSWSIVWWRLFERSMCGPQTLTTRWSYKWVTDFILGFVVIFFYPFAKNRIAEKILAAEMWFMRKVQGISWMDRKAHKARIRWKPYIYLKDNCRQSQFCRACAELHSFGSLFLFTHSHLHTCKEESMNVYACTHTSAHTNTHVWDKL